MPAAEGGIATAIVSALTTLCLLLPSNLSSTTITATGWQNTRSTATCWKNTKSTATCWKNTRSTTTTQSDIAAATVSTLSYITTATADPDSAAHEVTIAV